MKYIRCISKNWPDTTHYEFLADTMWSDFAYGRNAVYPEGTTVTRFFLAIPLNIMKIGRLGRR
ncbi:Endonuclease/Exonuclease/ phosphatase family protein [Salmonella enterica subsp. enterica]|uniref:Endonuclease/Exonuclease/ phosphatase family protein n=1 Tax=Salmonella enterica I TaxID=59201 RepID=A0A379ULY0_SALET|nr:Endonuclease/Exonuclease/ phosphatase family protein [Salmonella enterica subsp. enterica]